MEILVIDPQFEDVLGGAREVSYVMAEVLSTEHEVTLLHGSSRQRREYEEFYDIDLSNVDYVEKSKPLLSRFLDSTGRFHLLSRMKADESFLSYGQKKRTSLMQSF